MVVLRTCGAGSRFGKALADLPDDLRVALVDCGVEEPAVVRALFEGSETEAQEIIQQLLPGLEAEQVAQYIDALVKLWDACAEPAARRIRQLASSTVTEEEVKACLRERTRQAQRSAAPGGVWLKLERDKRPPRVIVS